MLAEYLAAELKVPLGLYRFNGLVKGFRGVVKLWLHAFLHAGAGTVITVQRMAIPAILRSCFTRNKVIVVFHHYDKREKLSIFYHLNAWLLFRVLAAGLPQVKVVVVADFWRSFLEKKGVPSTAITLVPNLFDQSQYQPYKNRTQKANKIYFGQYSSKQHPSVFTLVNRLEKEGYDCFFTTPALNNTTGKDVPVKVLNLSFNDYLANMASSKYTVCLNAFNEGWNRVAHESLLCGVQVVGTKSGGLGELIDASNQFFVNNAEEAYEILVSGQKRVADPAFFSRYDISQISYYAQPIAAFCKG